MRETPGSIPGSPNSSRAETTRRVAFLYAYHPSGHSGAATALQDQLRLLQPALEACRLELTSDLHPFFGSLLSKAYLEIIQSTPKLWDYLYDNQLVAEALREFRETLTILHRRKLRDWLAERRPNAIVCTHALPCATLAIEKERGNLGAPLVAVLTDFGVHAYWISKRVDLYLAPNAEVKRELVARGVAESAVRVTGIPIHPRFARPPDRKEARRDLGLAPDAPTLLICGGTKGLGPIRDIVPRLLAEFPKAQILAVCGDNAELFHRLGRELEPAASARKRLKVMPYADDMPACLAASDILVGKAGGMTASEALAVGVPMIIFSPLPGQEERNAAHLVANGAALRAKDQAQLVEAVRSALSSPGRLEALIRAARDLGRPDSAAAACKEILNLL